MNKVKASKHEREIIEVFMGYADGYLSQFIDWNTLMPAVSKFISLDLGMCTYQLYLSDSLRTANISEVYEMLITCIQWYNTNHLNKQDK